MDVVAYSNGDAVIVNMPSVKKLGQGETSFTTESSSATNEDEEAENNTNDPVPTGPLSGFLQRRAQRIAARASLREERQRKEEARTKAREEEQRRAEEEQAKIKEAIPERLIEPDLESTRAGTISATVVKTESNSYGLGLEQIKEDVVRFKALVGKGLLRDCPLRVGDIVKTVNDEAVTEYRSVMLKLMKMNGPVTITVENPSPQSNPAVVQAFCRKPNRDARFGIQLDVVEHSTTQNELCGDLNGTQEVAMSKLLQIKAINAKGLMGQSALSPGDFILAINGTACAEMSVEEAASLVAESEFTLDILALNPELAQKHCSPTRLQRWLRSARRTGVGAVGGTMLGLGLIMIPLPFPPPFGEVLVVGGVSVLGTEFEAPKRVMRNARNALQNVVGDDGKEEVNIEKLKQMESVATEQDTTDQENNEAGNYSEGQEDDNVQEPVILRDSFLTIMSQQQDSGDNGGTNDASEAPVHINDCWSGSNNDATINNMYDGKEHGSSSPTTTKDFLKNVGRNVVLPFLDHVVGDKQKEGETLEEPGETIKKSNSKNECC